MGQKTSDSSSGLHEIAQPLDTRILIEGQLRECYGRVVYSHKTHEKCADILLMRLSRIKLWQIILSAVTTGGLIAVVLGTGQLGAIVSILTSTALFGLNTYTKDYDLGELALKHRQTASDLWIVREKYLSLLTDLRIGKKNINEIQLNRDALLDELNIVYKRAPITNFNAYKKAQEALRELEEMTYSDKEIDAFLPNELKKS